MLVILLGRVEDAGPDDLRGDRLLEPLLEGAARGLGGATLRRVAIEDRRVVLGTAVAGLPVGLGWVDVVPEGVHQLLIGDLARVVDDLHRLEVAGATRRDRLVGRVRGTAAHEAHGHGHDPIELVEGTLHGPEAAAGERGGVDRRRAHYGREYDE